MLGNLFVFVACWFFIQNQLFLKENSLRNTSRVSNSLDPDQARHCVGPDLGPSFLQSGKDVNKV